MNRTVIWVIAISIVIVLLAWFFSVVFFYVLLSVIIATALRPVVNIIAHYEVAGYPIPRVLAIAAAYAGLVSLLIGFVLMFLPLITDQVAILSNMDIDKASENWMEPIRQLEHFLIERQLTNKGVGFLEVGMKNWIINAADNIDMSIIFSHLISITGSLFIGTMAVIFITSFLLYERGVLRKGIIALIPNKYFEVFINALHKIEKLLSNYLLGLLLQMFTIFTLASLGLSILGVKYAVTIALFAAIANVIPYLGPIVGSLFGILIGLLPGAMTGFTEDTWWQIIEITSVFAIVQITDNLVIQPLIFSKSVKAHPLEIFVIIFVGATIAGIFGMIAAIPVYTIVRVSVAEMYSGLRRYRVFNMI
jgi:predicted PurR-regulated permease PerM